MLRQAGFVQFLQRCAQERAGRVQKSCVNFGIVWSEGSSLTPWMLPAAPSLGKGPKVSTNGEDVPVGFYSCFLSPGRVSSGRTALVLSSAMAQISTIKNCK